MIGHNHGDISHYPVLAMAVAKTTGPVLELGTGWGSTPLLHALCRDRQLVSVESNAGWYERMQIFASDRHRVQWCEPSGWIDMLTTLASQSWSVAFVDFAPGELRGAAALLLANSARHILLHDAECDPPHGGGNYRYDEIYSRFRFVEHYRICRPATAIVGNVAPLGIDPLEATA